MKPSFSKANKAANWLIFQSVSGFCFLSKKEAAAGYSEKELDFRFLKNNKTIIMDEAKHITALRFAEELDISVRTLYRWFKEIGYCRKHRRLISPDERAFLMEAFRKRDLTFLGENRGIEESRNRGIEESRNRGTLKIRKAKENNGSWFRGAIWHGMSRFGTLRYR